MRLWAIAPVVLLGLILSTVCFFVFRLTVYNEAKQSMRSVANSVEYAYSLAYPGDYGLWENEGVYELMKGSSIITRDYSIIDRFKEDNNIELSVTYGDMRVHTTFKNNKGQRMAGISTNQETTEQVLNNGKDAFYKDVVIDHISYLVYYAPLHNSDDAVVGMIEVARTTDDINKSVSKAILPIFGVCIIAIGFLVFYSNRNTSEITGTLGKIQSFLDKITNGNLHVEMDTEVLKREDELGEISKATTSMQRSIRNYVETDPLTGLNNRRYVEYGLDKIMEKAKETGLPFAVAIGDIDFFKKVNDTYGHNAGDEVLKAVASKLKNKMQGNGFAARWGGEEFLMVFDKCGMDDAEKILWSLLEEIREMVVQTEGYDIKITMTYGVTEGEFQAVEALVEKADNKLYYGKQHGRNQVVKEIPEETPSGEENAKEQEPAKA